MTPRAETRSSPLRFVRLLSACLLLSLGWYLGGWHLWDADAAAQNRPVGIILDVEGATDRGHDVVRLGDGDVATDPVNPHHRRYPEPLVWMHCPQQCPARQLPYLRVCS